MHTLQLHKTDAADRLAWPVVENKVSVTSSAMAVFTDFKQYMPHVIDENAPATRVEKNHASISCPYDAGGRCQ